MALTRATGKPIRRVEDPRFLAGVGRYVEDVQPQDVVHLAFVRSPYPSARLVSVDVAEARSYPGVLAVATAQDIAGVGDVPVIPLPFAKVPPFPPLARGRVARVLGLDAHNIRVISPDVGGGFGAKSGATPEYILAAFLARNLQRPVKWVATRSEDIQVTTQGRDMLIYVDLAAQRDGTITGIK